MERAGWAAEEDDKNATLIGDVQEYWGFYTGEGAGKFWHLKYL